MSCRGLETGSAKDLSGVVRISRGSDGGDGDDTSRKWEEKELMYFARKDGAVTVWERGARSE